jgi:hypothetical protein
MTSGRQVREHVQQQRRLSDPGFAGDEHYRSVDQASAQNPIHAAQPRR